MSGQRKAIPLRGSDDSQRSRQPSLSGPGDKEVPSIRGAKQTRGCGGKRGSNAVMKVGFKDEKKYFIFYASRNRKPMKRHLSSEKVWQ